MKEVLNDSVNSNLVEESEGVSRRRFIGTLGVTVGALGVTPFLGGTQSTVSAAPAAIPGASGSPGRMNDCFAYRRDAAIASRVNVGRQSGNGDIARYTDYSGIFAKGLLHDALGIPNLAAAASLIRAWSPGSKLTLPTSLWEAPGGGGNSKLNGPQGALAFDLQGVDSHATVIPASPTTASAQTAAEAIEHYWAGVLRDVPFAQYGSNSLVAQACADLNNMSYISGLGQRSIQLSGDAAEYFPRPVYGQRRKCQRSVRIAVHGPADILRSTGARPEVQTFLPARNS